MKRQKITAISAILAAVLTALILVIVITTGVARVHASEISGRSVHYESIRIEEGDSLWSIAARYPSRDSAGITSDMKKIASLNDLRIDAILHVGGYLLIPVEE